VGVVGVGVSGREWESESGQTAGGTVWFLVGFSGFSFFFGD
jgi:hypothetical protein